jgi:hypothetical protein
MMTVTGLDGLSRTGYFWPQFVAADDDRRSNGPDAED